MKHASPLLEALWAEQRTFSAYEAFLDLINLAARRPTAMKVGRARLLIERGELVTSTYALADRWRWSQKAVRNYLAALRGAGELLGTNLKSRKQGAGLKLTLCNFDSYTPPGLKATQARTHPKSKRENEIAASENHVGTQQPPHTPPVVKASLLLERSLYLRGSGGEVADARDVEKPDSPHTAQLELPPPVAPMNPEHLRYAEALAAALNEGQAGNGLVDRDTYRPLAAHHPKTLLAALAIKNAGVPLLFAATYARTQAAQYKPKRQPQIHSAAYVEGGCIREWHALEAKHHQRVRGSPSPVHRTSHPAHAPTPPAVRPRIPDARSLGDVLAGLLRDVRAGGSS